MTFWNAVLWLHLLAMAFFVGGQLMLAAVVVPVLRGAEDRGPLRAAARRFGIGTLIAVGVLIVVHMRRPEWHVLDAGIFLVSLAIVWLGIVVAG